LYKSFTIKRSLKTEYLSIKRQKEESFNGLLNETFFSIPLLKENNKTIIPRISAFLNIFVIL
jgi:hypothetical protein